MEWKVPLFDVDFQPREIAAVEAVLKSKWLTLGEVTQRFEEAFARYLEADHALAVSSGTAAIHLSLLALGIGAGDEVITPSLTFVAAANSILAVGARPVFCEIGGRDDWNISPADIEKKITPRTRAILIVHFAGFPCRMNEILDLARSRRLAVIEDAAHAPGAEYRGKKCGGLGDAGCFSFFTNKNMTTGEGGMVVTNREDLAERIKLLRSHGMTSLTLDRHRGHNFTYDVVCPGFNYRIDEMRSALGLCQLEKLEGANQRRRELVDLYRERLFGVKGVDLPFRAAPGTPAWHIFPILLNKSYPRRRMMEMLKRRGIQTSIHYRPIHLFRYYRRRFGYGPGLLPLTEEVGEREITLPLYPLMADGDVEYVCAAIRESLENMDVAIRRPGREEARGR